MTDSPCIFLAVPNNTYFCGTFWNSSIVDVNGTCSSQIKGDLNDLTRVIGPLVLGYQFNWGLYGLLTMQVYMYSQSAHSDRWKLQTLVYSLFLLETVQTIFATHDSWFQLANYTNNLIGYKIYFMWLTVPIITGITSMTIQCFYAWRIHLLGGSRYLSGFIVMVALMQGSAAIAEGVDMKRDSKTARTTAELFELNTSIVWLGGTAACDAIICTCMVWLLSRKESSFRGTKTVINNLISLVIETGMATAILAIVTLILFLNFQDNLEYISPAFMISKLYTNSLLVILLNRPSTREGLPDFHLDGGRISTARGMDTDRSNNIQVTICRETYEDGLAMVTLPTSEDDQTRVSGDLSRKGSAFEIDA